MRAGAAPAAPGLAPPGWAGHSPATPRPSVALPRLPAGTPHCSPRTRRLGKGVNASWKQKRRWPRAAPVPAGRTSRPAESHARPELLRTYHSQRPRPPPPGPQQAGESISRLEDAGEVVVSFAQTPLLPQKGERVGYTVCWLNRKQYPCQDLHFYHHKTWRLLDSFPARFFPPIYLQQASGPEHLSTPRLTASVLSATR